MYRLNLKSVALPDGALFLVRYCLSNGREIVIYEICPAQLHHIAQRLFESAVENWLKNHG